MALLCHGRRRPSRVGEAGEALSLQPPVPSGEDAQVLEVGGVFSSLGEVAKELGYSRHQCQRWFIAYRREGLEELLVSRVGQRGPKELVTDEALKS
jgi:hypothetical protein